jgi:hypothetical protein
MCDDPTSLTPDAREAIEKYADKESREMGFDNWIDAYHWTPDSEANAEPIRSGGGVTPSADRMRRFVHPL